MKNLVFFFSSLLLLGACSCNGVVDLPKEATLNITVSNNLVKQGETVTVTCSAINAERTSNNIGAPTGVNWTYNLVVISKITISVTAYGSGKSVTQEKTVDILPVIVPTANDTLRSHGWKLKRIENWKKSTNTLASWEELSEIRLSDVTFFTTDGYWHIYHAGQTIEYGGGKYTLVGKILTIGDFVYRLTLLNDLKLEYELDDPWNADQIIKYFYEKTP